MIKLTQLPRSASAVAFGLLCCFAGASHSQPLDDLGRAAQPLADGVPQVAVVRLRELLTHQLNEDERGAATIKLGKALIAAEQPTEALAVLADAAAARLPERKFFQAQAHAALGEWNDALVLYRDCVADAAARYPAEARVGEAEALRGAGRVDEAMQALNALAGDQRVGVRARFRLVELLLDKGEVGRGAALLKSTQPRTLAERKQRRFLDGWLALKQGDPNRASDLLGSILKAPQGATRSVIVATLFGFADAHLQMGTPDTGDDPLEDFVEHYPTDQALPEVFAKLDQLYAAEKRPSRHELGRWSNDAQEPRRALALWYLARAELRLGHRDLARDAFARLQSDRPHLPVFAQAFLEHAQLELDDHRPDDALRALDAARAVKPTARSLAQIDFLSARVHYAAARFDVAAEAFQRVANTDRTVGADAFYNASLAWLQAGENGRFSAAAAKADPKARGQLMLEQGLAGAAKGNPEATATLQTFVRDFPQDERAAEAWVALAELAFHAAPPRIDEARQALARAMSSHPPEAAAEHAEYLAIWLEDAGGANNDEKIIALANEFLQKRATSPLAADVRLKLAETYYRREDFPGAQTQFEILAQRNPTSPEAEKAQYFAAQSAAQSMGAGSLEHALVLFDAVVKRDGELKWLARNEQAAIERRLGKPQDALTLYDEVTRGEAKPPEKREALCGKADILFELGGTDPENYRRAIDLYDQLAAQKDVPAHWRNQALFKKGVCLEKLQAPADALATFYRIVEDENRNEGKREYFWFYKAGFNAARLLEEGAKWQPAAAVYEKLAFAGGERSEEAKSRLNRLRLEHFLWDQ